MTGRALLQCFIIVSTAVAAVVGDNGHRYGVMIDAGSEGSRVVIFKWKEHQFGHQEREMITATPVGNFSLEPGIGSFALDPQNAGESLGPLVDYAKANLAAHKDAWPNIPIWLRATAGMRLLHADERENVLDDVRDYLRQCPFYFQDTHAYVITGEEEGIFGWLAVNYHMGNFQGNMVDASNTVGALDLGGASVQIVFIPQKSIMSHVFPLKLGTARFRVYTWSFLHFGQREASHRASDVIISDALEEVQSISSISHPCFPIGYQYKPSFGYSSTSVFPLKVTMNGSSHFRKCEDIIKRTFKKTDAPCLVDSCSFYGVYQPHVYDSRFVAFSHFADVAKALALPKEAHLHDLRIASEYVCSLSVQQLDTIFARVTKDYARRHLCFHSAYVYVLLTYGFGFDDDSSQISFQQNFDNGEPIDYIVGAMLYELNQNPWLAEPILPDDPPAKASTTKPSTTEPVNVLLA